LIELPIDAATPHQAPPERAGDDLLAPALRRARWTIFWERLWPALASIATVIGLFLALSWLGLWLWLPSAGRAIGLGVFFLLTAAAFAPLLMLRVPSRVEGLRRLDRNSGLPHRPATAIADEIAAPAEDSYSVALWRAHIERALRAAKTLRAGTPMPRLALRDPFALRALVAVLVVATFFAAGGERMKRIAAAFDWQGRTFAFFDCRISQRHCVRNVHMGDRVVFNRIEFVWTRLQVHSADTAGAITEMEFVNRIGRGMMTTCLCSKSASPRQSWQRSLEF
jgi:hypothetical protein